MKRVNAWARAGSPGTIFKRSSETVQMVSNRKLLTFPRWQAWYKPLPHCGAAIFVANHGNATVNLTIDLWDVPGLYPGGKP